MKPEEAIEVLNEILDVLGYAHYSNSREYIAVDLAIQALEKQVPKSYDIRCNSSGVCYDCPECGVKIDRYDKYCFNCGQCQDWSESE